MKESLKMKKKILLSLAAAFTCALLAGCGVTELAPEDFCSVDVVGANGYGTAKPIFRRNTCCIARKIGKA